MDDFTYENSTHLLLCAHQIGHNRREYTMRCHILKKMPAGRYKVLVFGNRYWKGRINTRRIRYVPAWRLRPLYG